MTVDKIRTGLIGTSIALLILISLGYMQGITTGAVNDLTFCVEPNTAEELVLEHGCDKETTCKEGIQVKCP